MLITRWGGKMASDSLDFEQAVLKKSEQRAKKERMKSQVKRIPSSGR